MEQNKIDMFIAVNSKFLSTERKFEIIEKLRSLDDSKSTYLMSVDFKNPTTWLLIYLFVPLFCFIDRIILGEVGLGIVKFITFGGFGIWLLVDIFTIMDRVKEYNYNKLSVYLT